jgi:DNA-binding transcriptional ArsR family regulator
MMTSILQRNVAECIAQLEANGDAPRGWEASLAASVEEALCTHVGDLRELAQHLVQAVHATLRSSPDAVQAAATRDPTAPEPLKQAFRLGQLGFAQLLISDAAERRAGTEFVGLLSLPKFRRYVEALAAREMTSSELADAVGEAQESASRKLQQLRLLGITDYRRESKNTFNFLTPAARQAFSISSESKVAHAQMRPRAHVMFSQQASMTSFPVTGQNPGHAFYRMETLGRSLEDALEVSASIPMQVIGAAEVDAIQVEHCLGNMKRSLPSYMRSSPTFALAR